MLKLVSCGGFRNETMFFIQCTDHYSKLTKKMAQEGGGWGTGILVP